MEIIGTIREVRTVKKTAKQTGQEYDQDLLVLEVAEPLALLTVEVPRAHRGSVAQLGQQTGKRVVLQVRAKGYKDAVYWSLSGAAIQVLGQQKAA